MRSLPEPPFRAALMLPRWLGDAVMGSALIEPLAAFSGAAVEIWGPAAYAELFVAGGDIAGFRVYEGHGIHRGLRGLRRFRREFSGPRPEVLWILPDSFSSALAARFAGIRLRVGRAAQGRSFLLSHALRGMSRDRSRHWSLEKGELLTAFSDAAILADPKPGLSLFDPLPDFEQWMKKEGISPNNYVIYAPGALFGPGKRWSGFAEFSSTIPESLEILLVGAEADREQIESLQSELRGVGRQARSYIGKLPLSRLARLFASARFTLSNDSGAMHLAAAAGGKVLGLFLSTDPVWTAPLGPKARVLAAEVDCRPCFLPQCPLTRMKCQDSLFPRRVREVLADWIEESP